MLLLWMLLLCVLATPAVSRAADLQYRLATLRVSGFSVLPLPDVAGYGRITGLPDNHLSTVVQPAGCALDLTQHLKFLTVTNTTTGALTMAPVVCFDGSIVESKRELRGRLREALTRRNINIEQLILRRCVDDPSPNVPFCTRLRALANVPDPEVAAVNALFQEAETALGALP